MTQREARDREMRTEIQAATGRLRETPQGEKVTQGAEQKGSKRPAGPKGERNPESLPCHGE